MEKRFTKALIAFCIASFMLCMESAGKFIVFETEEDFINKTPKSYDGFEFHSQKGKARDIVITIRNESNKAKVEIECSRIWGFVYKDRIFRVLRNGRYWSGDFENFYVMLIQAEGLFIWYRGDDLLAEVKKGATLYTTSTPIYRFASSTLGGDFLALPDSDILGKYGKLFRSAGAQFFTDNPELSWLQECARKSPLSGKGMYIYSAIDRCLRERKAQDQ